MNQNKAILDALQREDWHTIYDEGSKSKLSGLVSGCIALYVGAAIITEFHNG